MMDIERAPPKPRWQRFLAIGAVVCLALGWLVYVANDYTPSVERIGLWIEPVQRGEFLRSVRASGVLEPEQQRWLTGVVAGEVAQILLKAGDVVEADSVVLILKNPDLETQLRSAETSLRVAEAESSAKQISLQTQRLEFDSRLKEVRSNLKLARMQAEAEAGLTSAGIVSRLQHAQTQTRVEQLADRATSEQQRLQAFEQSVAVQMQAERTKVNAFRDQYRLRQQQVEGLQMRAGIKGRVQQVSAEVGKQVQIGAELALISQAMPLQAKLRVPQGQIQNVAVGMPVQVSLRQTQVTGKVERIAPGVVDGAIDVIVKPPGELPDVARPALAIEGRIELERIAEALSIPRPSAISAPGEALLFRLKGNDPLAERVSVQVGRVASDRVEILAGLAPGDQVILSDVSAWRDHDRLQVK